LLRNLLLNARDGQLTLPRGPLFTNRANTFDAAYGELVAKTAKIQKSNELLKLVDVFTAAGRDRRLCPMILGLGNRLSDALAYHSAGLAAQNIILIDQSSTIQIWDAPILPAVKNSANPTSDSSEYSSVVSDNSSEESAPTAASSSPISPHHVSASTLLARTVSAPSITSTPAITATSEGKITSYVDDDGVTHSAIFSTYRDSKLWKYADLVATHHARRTEEIYKLVYEELRIAEAMEAAQEASEMIEAMRLASER
jgi:hypothetical protein